MSNKTRFGLIGFGAWGQHHARVTAECPNAELVAIADRSPEHQAIARSKHPNAKVSADYRDIVNDPQIEVVDVALPSFLHFEVGSAALKAGKHVLMEKPLAVTIQECDDLVRIAEENNRLLAVGHEFRLSSLWGRAREIIEAGGIGDPQYVLIELWRNPYRLGAEGWRYDLKRVGNWILEEPIHFFDLARWYLSGLGEPVSVYARANARDPRRPELQDNFCATVNFPKGAYAVIAQTLGAFEHHQVVKITGSKGALWASWSGAMDRTFHPTFFLKHFDGEKVSDVQFTKTSGEVYELAEEIATMAKAARGEAPLWATGLDGKWSVQMCLKAQESVDTGKIVSF
jgi:myo-inositol 2-dehydrogenase/D-chiro-inositol 1-dehydrogenase